MRATCRANATWSSTVSGCRRRATTAIDLGRVRRPDRANGVPVGHPGPLRAESDRWRVRRAGDSADRADNSARGAVDRVRNWAGVARLLGRAGATTPNPRRAAAVAGVVRRPGSMPTLGIVVVVLIAVCVLTFRSDGSHRLVGVSFTVIAVLQSSGNEHRHSERNSRAFNEDLRGNTDRIVRSHL